jgi:hypothetical protein
MKIEISENVFNQIIQEALMLELHGILGDYHLNVDSIVESSLMDEHESLLAEAKYKGKEVKLGKPMRGDVKKFKVYVKNPKTGNVKKVNFGDPNMEIRRDNPKARKSFRARHGCGTDRASDRTKAAFWSCKMWSKKPVSKIVK